MACRNLLPETVRMRRHSQRVFFLRLEREEGPISRQSTERCKNDTWQKYDGWTYACFYSATVEFTHEPLWPFCRYIILPNKTTPAVSMPAKGVRIRKSETHANATGGPDSPPPLQLLVSSFPCLQLPRHDALRGFRCNSKPSSRSFPGIEPFYTAGGSRQRTNV